MTINDNTYLTFENNLFGFVFNITKINNAISLSLASSPNDTYLW